MGLGNLDSGSNGQIGTQAETSLLMILGPPLLLDPWEEESSVEQLTTLLLLELPPELFEVSIEVRPQVSA